ncbi:hypothetical protein [Roseovarius sp.]|uniref:hypothetical protein n=1 Tax=Roseovarius sp. TaxID=1486281 RepID=UPI003A96B104
MNASTATPIMLKGYRVPLAWFVASFKADTHALYVSDNSASALERVEVLDGGDMITLHDRSDPMHVTILTKAPTEDMLIEALGVIAESGA